MRVIVSLSEMLLLFAAYVYPMKAANFRGDMVGMFTYNDWEQGGFVDIDWFHYHINNR